MYMYINYDLRSASQWTLLYEFSKDDDCIFYRSNGICTLAGGGHVEGG